MFEQTVWYTVVVHENCSNRCVNLFAFFFFFPANMLFLILWKFWTADKLSTFDQPTALMQLEFVLQVRFRDL